MQVISTRVRCWGVMAFLGCFTLSGGFVPAQDDIFDDDLTSDTIADPLATPDDGSDPLAAPQDPDKMRADYEAGLAEAQTLIAEEKWTAALVALQELSTAGMDPRVQIGLGVCYAETGSLDLAITSLSSALVSRGAAMIPGLTETANVYLGRVYLEKNLYREAQQKLADARQANPQSPEAAMLYGKALVRVAMRPAGMSGDQSGQAQLLQAVETLTRAIELKSDYGEAYLERGRALLQVLRIEFAVEDFQQAVEYLGPTSDASADLGTAYNMRAAQESAKVDSDANKIVRNYRDSLAASENYLRGATFGRQIAPWEKVDPLTQSPEKVLLARADVRISLAEELNNDESMDLYRAAVEDAYQILNAERPARDNKLRAHFIRGVAYRMLDDLPNAIEQFTKAIENYLSISGRPYSEAYLRRGICWFHQSAYDLAMQDFQAASNNPANPYTYEPRAMFWWGLSYARQNDHLKAIHYYTRAITASSQYTYAYLNRGLAYLHLGRYDQALEDFDFVIRKNPENEQANEFRGLAEQGMP